MNEKASEAISQSNAEPERALEFLKQAESFLKKIEKSKKATNIKTENNQSGESSFLNGRIQEEEKSVRVSNSSDIIVNEDSEITGHTIYKTMTAIGSENEQMDERPQAVTYTIQ